MDQSSDVQRQQLAQRIEIAKANLVAGNKSIWDAGETSHGSSAASKPSTASTSMPYKAAVKAEAKAAPIAVERDFFGRPIVRKTDSGAGVGGSSTGSVDSKPLNKSGAYGGVYFKFQEGFTNAVRRKVYTKDLL